VATDVAKKNQRRALENIGANSFRKIRKVSFFYLGLELEVPFSRIAIRISQRK